MNSGRIEEEGSAETLPQMVTCHINEMLSVPVKALDENLQNKQFVKAIDLLPNALNLSYRFAGSPYTLLPTTSQCLENAGKQPPVEQIQKGYFAVSK